MTAPAQWLSAFPLQQAQGAVTALIEGWTELAAVHRPHFNASTKEPGLTKRLKIFVENEVARRHGLLGMWSTEDIIGDVDPITGALVEERRTDIVYGWNDASQGIQLVFEFKRLGRQKKHRTHYLEDSGLRRFVTGIYGRRQAVAAMVGVLLDPEDEVVPPIRKALEDSTLAGSLKVRPLATGENYCRPSSMFSAADFDTDHDRPATASAGMGPIRVSHIFLPFGYPTSTVKPKKPKGSA